MWRTNRSRAAKEVLDGEASGVSHALHELEAFWAPLVRTPAPAAAFHPRVRGGGGGGGLWSPVSVEEAERMRVSVRSAAGPDGISARQWNAVPSSLQVLFFNTVLVLGRIPGPLKASRTVFIPKSESPATPADYRPISVVSVVVRHLHKILAARFGGMSLSDVRQRAFIKADGVAENLLILDSLLAEARGQLREVHVATIDVAKAFDSLGHEAIAAMLGARGLPQPFIGYVTDTYAGASTRFEVRGRSGDEVLIGKGVRQGDPLSPLIFNLAVDELLASIPQEVGFMLEGSRMSCLAFADDLVVVASSGLGMRLALESLEATAKTMGLTISSAKSSVLSMVPAGKAKKMKVLDSPQFHLGGTPLKQCSAVSQWRYLGVDFDAAGSRTVEVDVSRALERISRGPLKPQQRLEILRSYLLPRFTHGLVLGNVTDGRLLQLDRQVRRHVRAWLRLPGDVPLGYFHAPIKDGGMGIPSLRTSIPELTVRRINRLKDSAYPVAASAFRSRRVQRKLGWAVKMMEKFRTPEGGTRSGRKGYWTQRLHGSVDGHELRESGRCAPSTFWISAGCDAVPGRDYVQHVKVHINALPSGVRASRGVRESSRAVRCRAGCEEEETTAHIVQRCFRSHGGRVKRHDAVVAFLAKGFRDVGWRVQQEPHYKTSVGLRKPDLVACKGSRVAVVDAQIVSGSRPLNLAFGAKVSYYQENLDLMEKVAKEYGVVAENVTVSALTISWRGVWALRSYADLTSFGIPAAICRGITTRVLQGSHTNWTRWNQMVALRGGPRR